MTPFWTPFWGVLAKVDRLIERHLGFLPRSVPTLFKSAQKWVIFGAYPKTRFFTKNGPIFGRFWAVFPKPVHQMVRHLGFSCHHFRPRSTPDPGVLKKMWFLGVFALFELTILIKVNAIFDHFGSVNRTTTGLFGVRPDGPEKKCSKTVFLRAWYFDHFSTFSGSKVVNPEKKV